jgi:hypothetical protein
MQASAASVSFSPHSFPLQHALGIVSYFAYAVNPEGSIAVIRSSRPSWSDLFFRSGTMNIPRSYYRPILAISIVNVLALLCWHISSFVAPAQTRMSFALIVPTFVLFGSIFVNEGRSRLPMSTVGPPWMSGVLIVLALYGLYLGQSASALYGYNGNANHWPIPIQVRMISVVMFAFALSPCFYYGLTKPEAPRADDPRL